MLKGFTKKVSDKGCCDECTQHVDGESPADRQGLSHSLSHKWNTVSLYFLPFGGRSLRKKALLKMQVEDCEESECLFVMKGIEVNASPRKWADFRMVSFYKRV